MAFSEKSNKFLLSKKMKNLLFSLIVILVATFIAFYPSFENDFTDWDDFSYVLENENIKELSLNKVKYFFTNSEVSNYHPLTMLSLAINYKFSKKKMNPYENRIEPEAISFHTTNIIFHLLNTILVFYFIFLLSGSRIPIAFIVALLFGIHPMHVESVSWISERKDVLYTFFFMGGLITYLKYLNLYRTRYYIFTIILCVLSLLSKPAAVVFPLVLFLIDFYKKRPFNLKVFLDKIIFFALAITFGIITFAVQKDKAVADFETFTVLQRFIFASYGFIMYIYKLFIPLKLSAFYPYPLLSDSGKLPVIYYLSPFIVLIIAGMVWISIKKNRIELFGILFYFITTALVLQFISVGRAIMADRYTYMPYIGLFFIFGYFYDQLSIRKEKIYRNLFLLAFIPFSIWLVSLTHEQTKVWKNSETLWTNVIKNYPASDVAYKNRGNYYARRDDTERALKDYLVLVERNSKEVDIYSNLGNIYGLRQEFDKSLEAYSKAINLDSNNYKAYLNRAITYSKMKEYDKAILDYNKSIELNPKNIQTYKNRGYALLESGRFNEAINDYNFLIEHDTENFDFYLKRGFCKFNLNNYPEALADFQYSLILNPNNATTLFNISITYYKMNNSKSALEYALKAKEMGYQVSENYVKELYRKQ